MGNRNHHQRQRESNGTEYYIVNWFVHAYVAQTANYQWRVSSTIIPHILIILSNTAFQPIHRSKSFCFVLNMYDLMPIIGNEEYVFFHA